MKSLGEWVATDVEAVRHQSLRWLSGQFFFRDPPRATYADLRFFFAPADGIVVYQEVVDPDEPLVSIKGKPYSLRQGLRDPRFDRRSMVIGIFMTFYDVHVNRVPYPGRLSYRQLPPIDTYNHPMLPFERSLVADLHLAVSDMQFLRHNERVLNRVHSPVLGDDYYVLQIADYDVNCVAPFSLRQNQPYAQGQRFSHVRFGSQVDLIVPLRSDVELSFVQQVSDHVEAGVDPLIAVHRLPGGALGKEQR